MENIENKKIEKKEQNKNNSKKLIIVLVAVLFITVASFTYAYFTASVSGDTVTDVQVEIESSSVLTFSSGDPLYILANRENFTLNHGTLYDESTATVTYMANTTSEDVYYNVKFNINVNEFTYTTEEKLPEVILLIEDNEGNAVTEVDGLEYVTTTSYNIAESTDVVVDPDLEGDEEVGYVEQYVTETEISGFDITEKSGEFTVALDYELLASNLTIHEWNFVLYFVNLETSQDDNIDKAFSSNVVLEDASDYDDLEEDNLGE